jgi:hypothetical protein
MCGRQILGWRGWFCGGSCGGDGAGDDGREEGFRFLRNVSGRSGD